MMEGEERGRGKDKGFRARVRVEVKGGSGSGSGGAPAGKTVKRSNPVYFFLLLSLFVVALSFAPPESLRPIHHPWRIESVLAFFFYHNLCDFVLLLGIFFNPSRFLRPCLDSLHLILDSPDAPSFPSSSFLLESRDLPV